jgi:hypothetical protein
MRIEKITDAANTAHSRFSGFKLLSTPAPTQASREEHPWGRCPLREPLGVNLAKGETDE